MVKGDGIEQVEEVPWFNKDGDCTQDIEKKIAKEKEKTV